MWNDEEKRYLCPYGGNKRGVRIGFFHAIDFYLVPSNIQYATKLRMGPFQMVKICKITSAIIHLLQQLPGR